MASNLRVDSIVPATGTNVAIGTVGGGVNIPGVLTYEDVTNVDSVGVITARSGINVTSGSVGINTVSGNEKLDVFGAIRVSGSSAEFNAGLQGALVDYDLVGNAARFGHVNGASGSAKPVVFVSGGTERLRIGSAGQLGIGGANYGTSGQVLTSQGSGSAVQWATPSSITTAGGTMTLGFQDHVSGAVSSTTPTAYYQRIGNMVFCSCDTGAINLSGLNNGQILLVTGCFPITRDNNWTLAGSAYQYTVTSNQNSGGATIVPTMGYWLSNTSLYFVIPRVSSTSDNLTVGMCNSNNTRIFMQWHYKVA